MFRLKENYEPLTQQLLTSLFKEIDRLFDELKQDLSSVLMLQREWRKVLNGKVLNESKAPLDFIVKSGQIIKELQYQLRENAELVAKAAQIIDLYKDKVKQLAQQMVFREKKLTPEEHKQNWLKNWSGPGWKSYVDDLQTNLGQEVMQYKLDTYKSKLQQLEKENEALKKGKRGTGGRKIQPQNTPAAPEPPPQAPVPQPQQTALPTAERENLIKLGLLIKTAMRSPALRGKKLDQTILDSLMKKMGYNAIEDLDISHVKPEDSEKLINLAKQYHSLNAQPQTGNIEPTREHFQDKLKNIKEKFVRKPILAS